jgi:hypothetical protein
MNDLTIFREAAARRGKRLEYFTIAWNSLEALIGIGAGTLAGSISLVGFGIDSLIEVTSGATLLWRMSVDADAARRERNERLSLRIVGAGRVSSHWLSTLPASLSWTWEGKPRLSEHLWHSACGGFPDCDANSFARQEERRRYAG